MDLWLLIATLILAENAKIPVTFTEAVVKGLPNGGGLFVPETLPHLSLDEILSLTDFPYAKRAAYLYRAFGIDLPEETIDQLMDSTYGDRFDDSAYLPNYLP